MAEEHNEPDGERVLCRNQHETAPLEDTMLEQHVKQDRRVEMKLLVFAVSAYGDHDVEKMLNVFLESHRISLVDRKMIKRCNPTCNYRSLDTQWDHCQATIVSERRSF